MTEPHAETRPIPAFVNPEAGSAADARAAIEADPRFALRLVPPARLAEALRAEVRAGTPRVLVSGGDGTLTTAARALAGSATALAILPGGTLNHFARDVGLPPDDRAACLEIAVHGSARPADAATVNDLLFLNTSSVGAYVSFVRAREALERWLPYRLASVAAAIWTWVRLRGFTVVLREGERAEDPAHRYESPLVFLGVGERSFDASGRGGRTAGGAARLHVVVLRERSRARVIALAVRAAAVGLEEVARTDAVDVALVEACEIHLRRRAGRVGVDGELVRLDAPLRYRLVHDALLVVAPPPALAQGPYTVGRDVTA